MYRTVPTKKTYITAFIAAGAVFLVGLILIVSGMITAAAASIGAALGRGGFPAIQLSAVIFGWLLLGQACIVAGIGLRLLADNLRPKVGAARFIYGAGTAHMVIGFVLSGIMTFWIVVTVVAGALSAIA